MCQVLCYVLRKQLEVIIAVHWELTWNEFSGKREKKPITTVIVEVP